MSDTRTQATPARRDWRDLMVDAMNRGPRITDGWSGERQVVIVSVVAAAVAVGAMFLLERAL